jgi:hypothetical protein
MLLEEICHSRENTESKTYLIIHQKPLGFCAYAGMTEIKKHICQKHAPAFARVDAPYFFMSDNVEMFA